MPKSRKFSVLRKTRNKRVYDRTRKVVHEKEEEITHQIITKRDVDPGNSSCMAEAGNRMHKTREREEYKEHERAKNKMRMKEYRLRDDYHDTEIAANAKRMRTIRTQENYRNQELVTNAERIRQNRTLEDYRNQEKVSNTERMRDIRTREDYHNHEILVNAGRMRQIRTREDYRNQELVTNAERIRQNRTLEDYRNQEKVSNTERMRDIRTREDYHNHEILVNAGRMRQIRTREDYRNQELVTNAERIRQNRTLEDYRDQEKVSNTERMRDIRTREDYHNHEIVVNAERMRQIRTREDYRNQELVINAKRIQQNRTLKNYRDHEIVSNTERMRNIRNCEDYRNREIAANTKRMREARTREDYRSNELIANAERVKNLRLNTDYNDLERLANAQRMKQLRATVKYSQNETLINRMRMQNLREIDSYRNDEKHKDKLAKRNERGIEILRYRDSLRNRLLEDRDELQSELFLSFFDQRKHVPSFVCSSCEGAFFQNGVISFTRKSIIEKLTKNTLNRKNRLDEAVIDSRILNHYDDASHNFLCHTCNKYICRGEVPKLASSWGFKLPPVPRCVSRLNDLEERMISPYVPFMDVRTLSNRASNPQYGMKGSVIHIPVDVNEMVTSIPRNFDNLNIVAIPVDWKRRMEYNKCYLQGFVRPSFIIEALNYLIGTELYEKYGIEIDEDFLALLQNDIVNSSAALSQEQDLDNLDSDGSIYDSDDECLLFDFNEQAATNAKLVIAPGQNRYPVSAHKDKNIEYLSFPKIFAGKSRKITDKNISLTDSIKWEIRYFKAETTVHRLLYLAKMKLEHDVLNSVQITMKKKINANAVTALQALNPGFITDLLQHNEGLKFLSNITNSPSYWSSQKKKVFAMIRQLGRPVFFLTVSAVETNWPELVQGLVLRKTNEKISLAAAMNLPSNEKYRLVKEDAVFTARYYDYRIKQLLKVINHSSGPFAPYQVTDFYRRREFQQRGSPHDHILLFLENAPILDPEDQRSFGRVIEFADKFITCEFDDQNPYCKYSRHKHSDTCSKGRKNKQSCRFNFPKFVIPETMILEPLPDAEKTTEVKENLKKIKALMEEFYKSKERVYKEFDTILEELGMTMENYITAIRCSIQKLAIFYKRRSCDVDINTYNRNILNLAESNTDLQFIIDEYAVATYLVEYIAKAEAGLSKGLKDCQEELAKGNQSLQAQFRCIANKFLNSNVMSSSEAVYHCLGTSLSETSRAVIFINTSKQEDRVVFLKSNSELMKLDPDSTDIAGKSVITHYSEREGLNNVCLAEYAAYYFKTAKKKCKNKNITSDDDADIDDTDRSISRRKKARIVRYVRYKLDKDPDNYYREQLLLFLPWRNEENEIETVEWHELYNTNFDIINANRANLFILSDDALDTAILAAVENRNQREIAEIDDFDNDVIPRDQEIDILVQGGMDRPKNNTPFVYAAPPKIELPSVFETLKQLNPRQKEIVLHIYKSFTSNLLPLRIFISGSAGVGKSMVISVLYQLITHYLSYSIIVARDQQIDSLKVLLCAFSGKAAFLIGGNTLHSAFALPLMESANMPDLPMDVANNLRQQLLHVKLIIIDEISMVGSTIFSRIDTRMRQITGVNDFFGGISIITVGDFMQLSPVKDCPVFLPPKHSLIQTDISPLWSCFKLYELTEVMRQKDDLNFVNALNNFARGVMSEADIKLFKAREVDEKQVPDNAMRLYYRNADVENYNNLKIAASKEKEIKCIAVDTITGKLTKEQKTKKLNIWKEKPTKDCGGYPYKLLLKKGIKYMVTANLDVSDGLVNGATGTLMYIYCDTDKEKPKIIFVHFESPSVGKKVRLQYKGFMENHEINRLWTPIARRKYNLTNQFQKDHQVLRDQFPLVPCEALTIHKSQRQTYGAVCVDFRKPGSLTRQLVYVAVSRVSKLCGLYILGKFPGNMKSNNTIESSLNEMKRLREEHQLQLAFNNLENKTGICICYLNIRSLRSNIAHILTDKWYSRCDVLIFSETCTYANEQILIPGFEIFYRSDTLAYPAFVKKNIAKGVICLAKTGVQIDVKHSCQAFKSDAKGNYHSHVDLISFLVHDILIITGYKSPKTKFEDFKSAFFEFNWNNVQRTVLIGDFNFNLNDSCSYQVQQFRATVDGLHLNDCLQNSTATTLLGSRLDIIFSNFVDLQAGVYECYFSDHKPIFAILNKHNSTPLEPSCIPISLSEPKINNIGQSNSAINLLSTSVNIEIIHSESKSSYIDLRSDHYSVFDNDRNITTNSVQCSDVETEESSTTLTFSNLDWFNSIDKRSNAYDSTNKELLNSLRMAFLKLDIHDDLSASIMIYKSSIDYIANYLKALPTIYFKSNRDTQYENSIQILAAFKEVNITGDGNCQFNSISYALVGNEDFSIDLRAIAFKSVVENSRAFKNLEDNHWLESNTVNELLTICCTVGQYGNIDTLFALSVTLERCIIIMQNQNGRTIFFKIQPPRFDNTTPSIVLHLINPGTNNAHYNVLLPEDANSSFDFPNMEYIYDLRTLL